MHCGCLPPRYKNTNSKGYMHPDVYIIYNSQTMEADQMSTDRWMGKECITHTHTHTHTLTHTHTHTLEYYSVIKKIKFCHLQQHG